ncbi:hypothetical protein HN51_028371 [Arachis hypogaea]|uniref:Coiled-coil domain-containing protein n=1 Tax=Arachis hypogaea TaxID=3818 RepID=A0A445BJ36_ARAHY|nr:coiled-coil domain-containing protein 12 [Arachis hypogaea]QHO34874.1 Coiled-coil domain-containing protein [Arachis hypogaea]RYR38693.1 hypothetical protein Ahy_A09g043839 [Arachis hypogaea]
MGSEDDSSIEQAVSSRRERLLALRAAQELSNAPEQDQDPSSNPNHTASNNNNDPHNDDDDQEENLSMKFRNYVPHDKELQEGKLAPAVLPKFEDPAAPAPPPDTTEDPFLSIAPKKPNWDLRRDVQKKLDKLEKRTQKALYKLMEEQEKQKQLIEGEESNGTTD